MNAMELALGVIKDKGRVNRRLAKALREIDSLAASAPATKAEAHRQMLQRVSSIAVKALAEERTFHAKEQSAAKRVRRLTRT